MRLMMKHFGLPILSIASALAALFVPDQAFAHKDDCFVRYGFGPGSAFTGTTAWFNEGSVSHGIGSGSMKNKCKGSAINNCSRAEVMALIKLYAPVGSANFQNICTQGSIDVYYDTDLPKHDGKKTKDGYCNVKITCARPPCLWTNYANLQGGGNSNKLASKESCAQPAPRT